MRKTRLMKNDKIIAKAEANMRIEGFEISAKVKKDCHEMLDGKITGDKLVAKYIAELNKR